MWVANAQTLSLSRPDPSGAIGYTHDIAMAVADDGALVVEYRRVSEFEGVSEVLSTFEEFADVADVQASWPVTDITIATGVERTSVRAVFSTNHVGVGVCESVRYTTDSILPGGLELSEDGYLNGSAQATSSAVQVIVVASVDEVEIGRASLSIQVA